MAPQQAGKAPAGKCFCGNVDCCRTNHLTNTYCHVCGWVLPDKPLYYKPVVGAGKGGGKSKGKNGKGGGKGGGGGDGGKANGRGNTSNDSCTCCGSKGHVKADCRQKDKECHSCGKIGHIATVCRSKPRAGAAAAPELSDDALAAELHRRNLVAAPSPHPPAAEAEPERTGESITAKTRAKEDAYKKLLKLIDRKMEAEKSLRKIVDEVEAAAEASSAAEEAFKEEVAATHLAHAPKVNPAALNIGSFLGMDISTLKVDLGPDFENLNTSDAGVLKSTVDGLVAEIQKAVQATIGPLKEIVEKAKATINEANESAAKKRKGESGSASRVPSPHSPATHTCGSSAAATSASTLGVWQPAATPVVSPVSPSPAEKEAAAADKKAAAATAAAETATREATEAKAAAVEKEKTAREDKIARDGQIASALKGANESRERKAVLAKKEADDKEMSDI